MSTGWRAVADRAIYGLGVKRGDKVLVRDLAGRPDVLESTLIAIERRGAMPVVEIAPPRYTRVLLRECDGPTLEAWATSHIALLNGVSALLVLVGPSPTRSDVPRTMQIAWQKAIAAIEEAENARPIPSLVVAVPNGACRRVLGRRRIDVESKLLPALQCPVDELRAAISGFIEQVGNARALRIGTDGGHYLSVQLGDRDWKCDDGVIDDDDRRGRAHVSNLPAGSAYTTVAESSAEGDLHISQAGRFGEIHLRFATGSIVAVDGAGRSGEFAEYLDSHTGDARRIGHVGVGLNPRLDRDGGDMGWPIADEHIFGRIFVSLGENRYLGGQNASSLNIDFAVADAELYADGKRVVLRRARRPQGRVQ